MEVIVATVIATIAVVGLAYTFGLGRGFINRFEVGRAAMAAAQGQIELISTTPLGDSLVRIDELHQSYFLMGGIPRGTQQWMIHWRDDPADGSSASLPIDRDTSDLRCATVTILFKEGSVQDSVQLSRFLPAQ